MENLGFKILVVDDSLLNHAVLRRILTSEAATGTENEKTPYIIETANTGLEGLEKARSEKPDLILLDIIMPGMSGFEVLSQLKESQETKQIPVIIITGLEDAENEEKGLMLGAVDYITKPFKDTIVLARIKNHRLIVEQMRLIEHQSLYDPLTNIMNRRSFDFHVEGVWSNAIRQQDPLAILMIDIDHFKNFNDTYGHHLGDVVLQVTANAISTTLKRGSDLVFRWGGEEFIVLLPGTEIEGAVQVAERIRGSISSAEIPSVGAMALPKVTASIGAASIIPDVENTITDLIKNADKAMYTAKESGRNRVCSHN